MLIATACILGGFLGGAVCAWIFKSRLQAKAAKTLAQAVDTIKEG